MLCENHDYIMTDFEEVCHKCGVVNPSNMVEMLPKTNDDFQNPVTVVRNIPENHRKTPPLGLKRAQGYIDEKYIPKYNMKARHVAPFLMNELKIYNNALLDATLNLYNKPIMRKLTKGTGTYVGVAGCLYKASKDMDIHVSLDSLIEIILKHDLAPAFKRKKRITSVLRGNIFRIVRDLAYDKGVYNKELDIHPVILILTSIGSRCKYPREIIAKCADTLRALISKDPTVFAGHRPVVIASGLVRLYTYNVIPQGRILYDFHVSQAANVKTFNILIALMDKYGLNVPSLPRVKRDYRLERSAAILHTRTGNDMGSNLLIHEKIMESVYTRTKNGRRNTNRSLCHANLCH